MTFEYPERDISVSDVNFDAAYQGQPVAEGAPVLFDRVPWDIGAPQPVLVGLEEAGEVRGRVLDVGCGQGDNAIFLARSGHEVTGIDISPTAIGQAVERAAEQGAEAEFLVGDAAGLHGLDGRFDTVLSSAFYHCLPEGARTEHLAALHRVCRPGARLHLFTFGEDLDNGYPVPTRVDRNELQGRLGLHWNIVDVEEALYSTSFTAEVLREINDRIAALSGEDRRPAGDRPWPRDADGRIQLTMWHFRADRA
ncbi:class I SAM-dependent methyltransferase [Streptomyces sp. AV19]|uniref:class I SAM-dependent methyltransferase n=1 Tax=Streptomyces sp. AV19 TaxID=2793068 RepID=UPI0018FEAEBD|nr:class I SAM-dependent methyltransferase [Streptomyces sp. AV19]MBH1934326.1 class I SAM-dependent methyltransferase [Streptomyces sp. AV19]MDG4533366.1 class I SAM-dependent methyltransferase [Streptomyces sp. AV19]